MKKINFLFCLITFGVFGQQNYTDLDVNGQANVTQSNSSFIVTRKDNNRLPILETYTDRVSFTTAYDADCNNPAGGLISEDFQGGPGAITTCGPVISSAGDLCFSAGEIQDGFTITASNGTDTVYIPSGAIGNGQPMAGANTFVEFTILNFPGNDVYAVGVDIWNNSDPTTSFRVYGDGGVLLEDYSLTGNIAALSFFGFISDEVITRIEIEEANGGGDLITNLDFGICNILGVNENALSQIAVYPNPTSDIINIKIPASVIIQNVTLYDILGKNTGVPFINGTMDTSSLSEGVYVLNIKTTAGTFTDKVIKR